MSDKSTLAVPIMLLTVGAGWLLTTAGFAPGIDWIWSIGLAAVGVVTVVLGGWDKFTAVVGPFFLITSLLSVARQMGRLPLDFEMPILVMTFGALMLVARHPALPVPTWYGREPTPREK